MKSKVKFCFAAICFIVFGNIVSAQEQDPIPPSIEQFLKYGDYPVGHFTGVPDISIPIYTIVSGDIQMPISIKYHASGIKVSDNSGSFGLGWSLMAGGNVLQQVNAINDVIEGNDYNDPQTAGEIGDFGTQPLGTVNDADFLAHPGNCLYDIFTYKFNSEFGKFIMINNDTPLLFPQNNLKINFEDSISCSIVDANGITYKFGGSSEYKDYTTLLLSKIESALATDNDINLTYFEDGPYEQIDINNNKYIIDDLSPLFYEKCPDDGSSNFTHADFYSELKYSAGGRETSNDLDRYYFFYSPTISTIQFKNGTVEFTQDTNKMIEWIRILDKVGNQIKAYKFKFGTFPGDFNYDIKRYKLEGLQLYGESAQAPLYADAVLDGEYSFNYIDEHVAMPFANSPEVDFWGYYNNKTNSSSFNSKVPTWDITYYPDNAEIIPVNEMYEISKTIGSADRNPDFTKNQIYTLNKITYPTNGYTKFTYQTNTYFDDITNSEKVGGGLRIWKIVNYNSDNTIQSQKEYSYGVDECGWGIMEVKPTIDLYCISQKNIMIFDDVDNMYLYRRRIYLNEPHLDLAPNGSPVIYTHVTEYNGTKTSHNGYIKFEYSYSPNQLVSSRYHGHTDMFGVPEIEVDLDITRFFSPIKDWTNGKLKSKIIKDKYNNPVYSLSNKYEERNNIFRLGLKIDRYISFELKGNCPVFNQDFKEFTDTEIYEQTRFNESVFNYNDLYVDAGIKLLKESKETINGISITKYYTYNTKNQVVKVETKDSKGNTITQHTVYPTDFNAGSIEASAPWIVDMQDANMINKPIETYALKNGSEVLGGTHTVYNNGIDLGLPKSVYSLKKKGGLLLSSDVGQFEPSNFNGSYNLNEHYNLDYMVDGYQAGNLLQYHKDNNMDVSYLWGYNNTYPIAKVVNANYNEIFHDNFEENDYSQGWRNTLDNQGLSNEEFHSGKSSWKILSYGSCSPGCYYALNKGISASLLDVSKKYIFCAWVKCNDIDNFIDISVSVYDSEGRHDPAVVRYDATKEGEWQLLQVVVDLSVFDGITDVYGTIRNYGGASLPCYIDDIRFYPSDAQMTTYTYDPLVGMTSVSDNFGRVTKYDYDDFNRLEEIRDNEGFIQEKYHYHYAE